jgi:hypothetical protein
MMERETAITAVLGEVRERWGSHSLTRGYEGPRASGLLSSSSSLRKAAAQAARELPPWWPGTQGYVRPNVLEMSGPPSCGKLSLALLWLAAASQGGLVAVVDLAGEFYPPAAALCGLSLDRLVVVRPPDRRGAGEAVSLLLSSGGFDAILWPLEWRARPYGMDAARLSTLANRASTTLLALVTDNRRILPRSGQGDGALPSADARLRITAWEWLWWGGELAGVQPRVRAERLRGALAGQEWDLRLERHGLASGTHAISAWERPGERAPNDAIVGAGPSDGCAASADHLCLAAALPYRGGSARAAGLAGEADRGLRSDEAPAPTTRTA